MLACASGYHVGWSGDPSDSHLTRASSATAILKRSKAGKKDEARTSLEKQFLRISVGLD